MHSTVDSSVSTSGSSNTRLGDFLHATHHTKQQPSGSETSETTDDVTSSTDEVQCDSLNEYKTTHESSFARRSLLNMAGRDEDSSYSSCSSDDDDDDEDGTSFLPLELSPASQARMKLNTPLHRLSFGSAYDSLSFLKGIHSDSEADDETLSPVEEGDEDEDEDDHDALVALCSVNSKRAKMLGEGAFGQVWLTLHRQTPYALKVCSKYDLVTEGAVEEVLRERAIQSQLSHPFVCQLVASNQDDRFLYLLEEYCAGGELFSLLERNQGKLPESQARFYITCIADALTYLHKQRVVFRDLKPENILLCHQGYPKLIDFGCAKQFREKDSEYQTRTLCGTPRFVSPEMIEPERYGGGHSFKSDYWALGILLYEMLMGSNPYEYDGMTEMEVYESISDDTFHPSLSDAHSDVVKDLLNKLLTHDPSKRLGDRRVLKHRWFADMDLVKLRERPDGQAPWVPNLSDHSDTQYFEDWENSLESRFAQSYPNLSASQRHVFANF
jgi:hypothetical protein